MSNFRAGMTQQQFELEQAQEAARAWNAVFDALQKHNPHFARLPLTGLECVLAEIARLQALDKK